MKSRPSLRSSFQVVERSASSKVMCNFPLTDTGIAIIHLKRGKKNQPRNYKPESHLGQNYFPEKNVML